MPARKKQPAEEGAPVTTGRAKKPAAAKKPRATAAAPNGAGRGSHDLVIVESPTKAKTINKYLGANYKVLASYGHVRDLPRRRRKGEVVAGIDIEAGWVPTYVVQEKEDARGGKARTGRRTPKDILAELKREAGKANRVFLATDPDREGEAIAWHIEDALGLDDERTFRITFNEITRTAVQNALSHPGKVDMDRVHAQEARRILDRVVGYPLSGLLGKKVVRGSSAGRVQSVALRLVVDREREIEAFKSAEYWKIMALLAPSGSGPIAPRWHPTRGASRPLSRDGVGHRAGQDEGRGRRGQGGREGAAAGGPARGVRGRAGRVGRQEVRRGRTGDGRGDCPRPRHGVLRRLEDRAEGPFGEGAAAVHDEHAATAGQHPSALHRRPHHAVGAEAVRRRGPERRRLGGPHHLHAYRQHARFQRGVAGGARPHRLALRAAVLAGEAELFRVGQERPGGPRGDPADRRGVHAGARGAAAVAEHAAPPRPDAPVHADLQPLRGQPDDAGDIRHHECGNHGRTSREHRRAARPASSRPRARS